MGASPDFANEDGIMLSTGSLRCPWCDERIRKYGHYCPSPEEIEEACMVIRSYWTPEEERRRRFEIQDGWMLPTIAN